MQESPLPAPSSGMWQALLGDGRRVGPQGSAQSGNDYLTVSPHLLPAWLGTALPAPAGGHHCHCTLPRVSTAITMPQVSLGGPR